MVLSCNLLKDRRIDDNSPRFKSDSSVISLNQSECVGWLKKKTNELASFCTDKRLPQMAIFTSLQKDLLYSFSIKTNKIVHDLSLYHVKQRDSMLLCVGSVIDHRRS